MNSTSHHMHVDTITAASVFDAFRQVSQMNQRKRKTQTALIRALNKLTNDDDNEMLSPKADAQGSDTVNFYGRIDHHLESLRMNIRQCDIEATDRVDDESKRAPQHCQDDSSSDAIVDMSDVSIDKHIEKLQLVLSSC